MNTIQDQFKSAVNVIKKLPKDGPFQPSNNMALRFYSLYKQAVNGPCDLPKPGFWDVTAKAKWDSWMSLGNLSEEKAMSEYIDQLKQVIEAMPHTNDVDDFLQTIGDFYVPADTRTMLTREAREAREVADIFMHNTVDKQSTAGDSGAISDVSINDLSTDNIVISEDEFCDTIDYIDHLSKDSGVNSNDSATELIQGKCETREQGTCSEELTQCIHECNLPRQPLFTSMTVENDTQIINNRSIRMEQDLIEIKIKLDDIEKKIKSRKNISPMKVFRDVYRFLSRNTHSNTFIYFICPLLFNILLVYIFTRRRL